MQLELVCFLFHSGLRVGTVRSDCLGFHPSSVLAQMRDFVQITPSLCALVFSLSGSDFEAWYELRWSYMGLLERQPLGL